MVIFHSYVNVYKSYQRVVDPNVGKTIMNHPPKSPKSPISRDMFTIPKWFIIVLLTLLLGFQPSKVQDFATIHNSVNICFWDYSDYVGIWWELVL